MATTKEVLVKARELVARGWCQGAYAVLASGDIVGDETELAYAGPDRVCNVCVEGALILAGGGDPDEAAWQAVMAAMPRGRSRTLHAWNDANGRTKREVLRVLDRAIASCDEEPRT